MALARYAALGGWERAGGGFCGCIGVCCPPLPAPLSWRRERTVAGREVPSGDVGCGTEHRAAAPCPMDAAVPPAAGGGVCYGAAPLWVGSPFIALAFQLSLLCPAASPATDGQWRGAAQQQREPGGLQQGPPPWVHFMLWVQVAPQQQSLAAGKRMAGTRLDTGTSSGLVREAVGARGAPSPWPADPLRCPSSSLRRDGALAGLSSSRPLLGRCLPALGWNRTAAPALPSEAEQPRGKLRSLPPFALHYIHFFFWYRLKPGCWGDQGGGELEGGNPQPWLWPPRSGTGGSRDFGRGDAGDAGDPILCRSSGMPLLGGSEGVQAGLCRQS